MFIHEINLIKRIDPSNPLELNQITVYLILKNEKEKGKYDTAIHEIEKIMEDPRCPYKKLVILYKTKELMSRVGDKSSIAAFQEFNVMVRLFNHPTNHDYKYSFGQLSLDNKFVAQMDFLQFLSEAACENMISLTASLWLSEEYSKDSIKRTIKHFLPLVAIYRENGDDQDILRRWIDKRHFYKNNYVVQKNLELLGEISRDMEENDYDYFSSVKSLPLQAYGSWAHNEIDENAVHIKLISGQYRQTIDFEVIVNGESYFFHLKTKTGLFIYICALLAKYHNFNLLREYFQHQKGPMYFKYHGRRCTGWMNQLYKWITRCKGDFSEMYSQLVGSKRDYHTLTNEISKINSAIREGIQDPLIQEICIIKSKGAVGKTAYYVDLLPDHINLTCPFDKPSNVFVDNAVGETFKTIWNSFITPKNNIAIIIPVDEKKLPPNIGPEDLLDLTYEN